jgi:hypothetical protein
VLDAAGANPDQYQIHSLKKGRSGTFTTTRWWNLISTEMLSVFHDSAGDSAVMDVSHDGTAWNVLIASLMKNLAASREVSNQNPATPYAASDRAFGRKGLMRSPDPNSNLFPYGRMTLSSQPQQ